jgi:protein-S-isoprenylcysteine O-methyltransferase Ste14
MAKLVDNVSRVKGPSPLGTSIFIGLRSLDVFLQYGIVVHAAANPLLDFLGIRAGPTSAPLVAFGLPLKPILVMAMALGSSLKHSYWAACVSKEAMPVGMALMVPVFNSIFNSLNSILSLTAAVNYLTPTLFTQQVSKHEISPAFILGVVVYLTGILGETISEVQRRNFKDEEKNVGKPFTGGLFSLARHINYGSYTAWRTGYALASGGWMWATFVGSFFTYDFLTRGCPVLDEYCTKRYGASWAAYKKRVTYKLLPGVV